ncbi:MAG: phospholipase D/Transphosphatidylase [Anaerolineaceae bacterium]|nr:MAG: phospholipase D/Transphosphatidylase [Anaerolineaceae bacterium]
MKPLRSQAVLLFLALFIVLNACITTPSLPPTSTAMPGTPITPALAPTLTPLPGPSTGGWLEIYFTSPSAPDASSYEGGPDEILAAAIDDAILSVDAASYSLNLWSIRDALIRAHRRGVVVRMIMESDNMDSDEVQDLLEAGIPIVGDQREGLMHDKFVIIDRSEVWTGSMNFTTNGAYEDNNNLLRLRSVQIAENYLTEFDEMFTGGFFGPAGEADTPFPRLTLDGTPVEIYYSPDDGVAARIVALVQAAQESIHFMAYSFTSDDIGGAIRERAQYGLIVSGVMDKGQVASNQGTEYDPFRQALLDVRLDGISGLMHHKVIIIDEQIVITGSYNFSASAETRNDENVVIIFDPEVAAQYMIEFRRVFGMAQP